MISHYRELLFWQKAYKVTLLIIKLSRKLPRETVSNILINQIVRSSASVGANIAEGFGRYKGKEYQRFLQIALGSANETEYWLMIIKDSYPQFENDVKNIIMLNEETIKMLASSLKTLNNKTKGL